MKLDRVIAVRNDKTVYRDGEYCVKVFNENYSKSDVLREALHQAYAEEAGLSVPKIYELTEIEGKWAIVSAYIKGKTLLQHMQEEEKNDGYLDSFVNLHIEIQSQKSSCFTKLADKIHREIARSDFDDKTRSLLFYALENLPEDTRICHGDFEPANILVAEDGTPYILDWSEMALGHPLADVANTCLVLRLRGEDDMAKEYLARVCHKTGTTLQEVETWLPVVAAARSAKANARERGILRTWAESISF